MKIRRGVGRTTPPYSERIPHKCYRYNRICYGGLLRLSLKGLTTQR